MSWWNAPTIGPGRSSARRPDAIEVPATTRTWVAGTGKPARRGYLRGAITVARTRPQPTRAGGLVLSE
jgi:hypothetical protein